MLIIRQLLKFMELLHKETGENQLAAGFALGLFMGFTPMGSLFWAAYLVMLIMFRINIGAAFLSYGVLKVLSFALDPIFDRVGYSVLSLPSLRGLFVAAYQAPILPFTRFNNTIVMGSLVVSFLMAIPFYFAMKWAIRRYRVIVVQKIKDTWMWKAFKATKLFQLYEQYEKFAG